jgi:Zn-dependent alcohol dehydrogenase
MIKGAFAGQHLYQRGPSLSESVGSSMLAFLIVDKSLDLASLAPLGCGVGTGAGAVLNTLNAPAGSSIAIFGAGGVGLRYTHHQHTILFCFAVIVRNS